MAPQSLSFSSKNSRNAAIPTFLVQKKNLKFVAGAAIVWVFVTSFDEVNVFQDQSLTSRTGSSNHLHRILHNFGGSEEMQEWIDELDLGWSSPPADWLKDLCPEVVDHFTKFPSAKATNPEDLEYLPFLPTDHAAVATCTMKVMNSVAASLNTRLYLHAGSHLGAVVHGQGIPWDDDVDAFIDYRKKDELENICEGEGVEVHSSGVRLQCHIARNAFKVWLHYPGMTKLTGKYPWYSPFLDLFLYKVEDGRVWEVDPVGERLEENYAIEDYFPTRPYYFAGLHLLGPQSKIVESRYNLEICKMAKWNHRIEKPLSDCGKPLGGMDTLDCTKLAKLFPFNDQVNDVLEIEGNPNVIEVYPRRAAKMDTIVVRSPTIEERSAWFQEEDSMGQALSSALENLNEVEIDNSISTHSSCTGPLKVVELNAERGRWWMEATTLLQDADVIILNEMDIGMARSDQQHTTRLMAHFLGMNYAWGLEFVELTPGTEEDRYNANGVPDFNGLHGNGFLTKCAISDPVIFRNEIGDYFSSVPAGLNANGLEKRLGGRMGMFGKIIVDGNETVIGSVHKISGYEDEVKQYIGKRDAIIAGDQDFAYCGRVGLENIHSNPVQNTWPATCESFGRARGDHICSNMKVVEDEVTTMPCVTNFGFSTQIGDHADRKSVV